MADYDSGDVVLRRGENGERFVVQKVDGLID